MQTPFLLPHHFSLNKLWYGNKKKGHCPTREIGWLAVIRLFTFFTFFGKEGSVQIPDLGSPDFYKADFDFLSRQSRSGNRPRFFSCFVQIFYVFPCIVEYKRKPSHLKRVTTALAAVVAMVVEAATATVTVSRQWWRRPGDRSGGNSGNGGGNNGSATTSTMTMMTMTTTTTMTMAMMTTKTAAVMAMGTYNDNNH
jgi:hypothetical protein